MKPKGLALMIVEKLKKEKGGQTAPSKEASGSATESNEMDGDSSGLEACADEVISAVKSADSRALVSALKNFIEVYENEGADDSEAE